MYRVLGVWVGGYYEWAQQPESKQSKQNRKKRKRSQKSINV